MLPFLKADFEDLSLKLLALIIKPKILENYNASLELTKNDLSEKNMFLKKKDVHLGLAAEQKLRQLRLRDSVTLDSINKFRKEAHQFVLTLLDNFFARDQMKSAVFRNVSVFNPKQMVSEIPDQLKKKLKKLLHDLICLNKVTNTLAENSLSQYISFLQNDVKLKVQMFKQFSPTVNRLDDFFSNNVETHLPNEFASILKILLTLSHG